jgi:hypothetical protein
MTTATSLAKPKFNGEKWMRGVACPNKIVCVFLFLAFCFQSFFLTKPLYFFFTSLLAVLPHHKYSTLEDPGSSVEVNACLS